MQPQTVTEVAQSQTQTLLDVEACINTRDENQNLVWPMYSPLKARSRKPKNSPTLGGLELDVPRLRTRLSAQEMKIDVFLVLDAEFNKSAFSVAKSDTWLTPSEKGAQEQLLLCFYPAGTLQMWFPLHSPPRQFASLPQLITSLRCFFVHAWCMQVHAWKLGLSWSVKLLSVLNNNTGLQFLKMILREATDTGCLDADLQKMPGIILSFMTNRNTNNLWARSVVIDQQIILAASLTLHSGDFHGLRPPLVIA